MKSQTLKVIAIAADQDKNGKDYRIVTVSTPSIGIVETAEGEVKVKIKPRITRFTAWKENYLDGSMDYGYDVSEGELLLGTIVERKCLTAVLDDDGNVLRYDSTYRIKNDNGRPDTITDKYSTVVFGDTADAQAFEIAIEKAFRRAGHPLLTDKTVQQLGKVALLAEPAKEVIETEA